MILENKNQNNSSNLPSSLRHSLGYLPTVLLKEIIEDKILDKKDNERNIKFPKTFSFHTSCLFIDTSHFFDKKNDNNKNIKEDNVNNNNQKNIFKKITESKKTRLNDFDEIISPEFYYFCINRYYERLISIITNHGGDVIFQGIGIYVVWPPEKIEFDYKNSFNRDINLNDSISSEKKILLYKKAIQCALEIQKNYIMEIKQGCTFIPKIGCSIGECKFIIFQGINNKYDYIVLGDALSDSYECCNKDEIGGQIIIGTKMLDLIGDYFKLKEFYIDGIKYCSVIDTNNKENQIRNNKATVNLIKNNFPLEQIAIYNHKIARFNHDILFNLFQRNIFDEKWLKEIKNITLLFLRLKMNQKDMDSPKKLQEIFDLLQKIVLKNGGIIHKLASDNKGIFIILCFGLSKISSGSNELKGVLTSIELNAKLKQINVYPFIGITSGDLLCGLCGTIGNRREYSVLGSTFINAFITMEKAEIMYGDKKSGNDNILMDESTMLMINNKIPCKFWKKIISNLGYELNLFSPLKISTIIHSHSEDNLFPLIGCHLNIEEKDEEYKIDEDLQKEEYIIYFEENILKDYVQTLNDYAEKKSKTKLISVSGPSGCGKTMLLQKSLKTFFQMNPILREILCNSNYGDDYPFIFSSYLIFTVNNNILLNNEIKEYRGLQLVIKDIFNILYSDDFFKRETINLITKNDCVKYAEIFQKIFEIPELINNIEDIDGIEQEISIQKDMLLNINSFIYDLFSKYKKFLLTIYEEKLSKYNLDIPLIIIIEDFDLCDDDTKGFIKYYLKQEDNPFLIITAHSFKLFPFYNFLRKGEKDFFHEYNNENIITKYKLSPYDTEEKITKFCISILDELRNVRINSVSPALINFLLNKTFNGIPEFIKVLILSLYDSDLLTITKNQENQGKILIEDERFKKMIYFNDFTELIIPDTIQKKVGAIIDNYLDKLEIYLLKIASIIGNKFDLIKLNQAVRIDNTANDTMNIVKDNDDNFLYEKLCILQSKNIIEILYDLDIKNKFVVCKFSVPFLREILYQRTPAEYRNQMHYIIGKLVKVSTMSKSHQKLRYMNDIMELGILEKHLKYSQVSIHDNFLNGKFSTTQLNNDNYLNINNLKTLINRQICAKIKSIKINDDKNNMIKAGYIYKKSDGKLTWENRYFVLTTNRVIYFYNQADYIGGNKAPLGVFYLQNLFDIKLLTDGSVGGKKNIISLIVNEWFKKGEVMKSRIYYLRIEDREESIKWVITFNILMIKAFYEKYCFSFGYVNFPLYKINKNEFIFKQKKLKFQLPKKKSFSDVFKGRQNMKRMSIYSPYLSLGRIENKFNVAEYENFVIKQFLIYIKFLMKYSFSIFLGNIQHGLSMEAYEYEDSKLYIKFDELFDFMNPYFYKNIMHKEQKDERSIRRAIEVLTLKYKEDKKNNNLYSSEENEYTEKQIEYFNKYYKNHFINEHKMNFVIKKNFKNLVNVQTDKIVKNNSIFKGEIPEYLFFRNTEEPKIDKEDYLNYIEYTDNDGRLKEQYKRMDSGGTSRGSNTSISKHRITKIEFFSTKRSSMTNNNSNKNNEDNTPILNLLNKQNNERKKKLLFNEQRGSKINEDNEESSSKKNSLGGTNKVGLDKESKKLILSDTINSESNESETESLQKEKEEKSKKTNEKSNGKNNKKSDKKSNKKSNKNSNKKRKSKKKSPNKDNKKKNKNIKNNNIETKEKKIINESFESIESQKNIFNLSLGQKPNNNEEIKYISEHKYYISSENKNINTNANTNKLSLYDEPRESGKFLGTENNFKELLLKKLVEEKKTNRKETNILKNQIKNNKTFNDVLISKNKKRKEKKVKINKKENSFQNISGHFSFNLNLGNDKEEKIEENINLGTEKKILETNREKKEKKKNKEEEEKEKEKKIDKEFKEVKEKEYNEIISFSTKKEPNTLISYNLNKDIISNTISSIDNNLESIKNINGSNYHSINRLISDIGSRPMRRRSRITNSYFKKKNNFVITDMISNSSYQSNNLFNNQEKINNYNLPVSRCNSTQEIRKTDKNNFFLNNLKLLTNKKSNNISTQNSGLKDSLSLINKLKNLNVSLENERSFLNILKNLNLANKRINLKNNNSPKTFRIHSRNVINKKKHKNKVSSYDVNTASTKSTSNNFFYPSVYYISGENNLHKKIHFSTIFSKLKAYKNNNN